MASTLIKADIPAVVAMQFPIAYPVVKKFFESFYEELAAGKDIDAAVQTGREKIYIDPDYFESYIFGTPVLSVFKEDRIVKPVKVETTGGKKKGSDIQPEDQLNVVSTSTVDSSPRIDPGVLLSKAISKYNKLELKQEIRDIIGPIISELYAEKVKKTHNYESILERAIAENIDPQVQEVIFAMLQEFSPLQELEA
jgi:hypothetical protein